jgi:hypothetical protein
MLELLADKRLKKTFRLSSGTETYHIVFEYRLLREGKVLVDGEFITHTLNQGTDTMAPCPLWPLSEALGCDVTMQYAESFSVRRAATIELLIVTIGDQTVRYSAVGR